MMQLNNGMSSMAFPVMVMPSPVSTISTLPNLVPYQNQNQVVQSIQSAQNINQNQNNKTPTKWYHKDEAETNQLNNYAASTVNSYPAITYPASTYPAITFPTSTYPTNSYPKIDTFASYNNFPMDSSMPNSSLSLFDNNKQHEFSNSSVAAKRDYHRMSSRANGSNLDNFNENDNELDESTNNGRTRIDPELEPVDKGDEVEVVDPSNNPVDSVPNTVKFNLSSEEQIDYENRENWTEEQRYLGMKLRTVKILVAVLIVIIVLSLIVCIICTVLLLVDGTSSYEWKLFFAALSGAICLFSLVTVLFVVIYAKFKYDEYQETLKEDDEIMKDGDEILKNGSIANVYKISKKKNSKEKSKNNKIQKKGRNVIRNLDGSFGNSQNTYIDSPKRKNVITDFGSFGNDQNTYIESPKKKNVITDFGSFGNDQNTYIESSKRKNVIRDFGSFGNDQQIDFDPIKSTFSFSQIPQTTPTYRNNSNIPLIEMQQYNEPRALSTVQPVIISKPFVPKPRVVSVRQQPLKIISAKPKPKTLLISKKPLLLDNIKKLFQIKRRKSVVIPVKTNYILEDRKDTF